MVGLPPWMDVAGQKIENGILKLEVWVNLPIVHTFPTGVHCASCRRWVPNSQMHDHTHYRGYVCGWCGEIVSDEHRSHDCKQRLG